MMNCPNCNRLLISYQDVVNHHFQCSTKFTKSISLPSGVNYFSGVSMATMSVDWDFSPPEPEEEKEEEADSGKQLTDYLRAHDV